jgi:hypothetical protein
MRLSELMLRRGTRAPTEPSATSPWSSRSVARTGAASSARRLASSSVESQTHG